MRELPTVGAGDPDTAHSGAGRQRCAAGTQCVEELIGRVAAGDRQALSKIYEQTVAQIFAIARSVLRSREDAEEVVCDVYTAAWLRASSFDAARGSVMAWLAVMARHRAIDRLRQRRETLSLDDKDRDVAQKLCADALGPEQLLTRFQSGSAVHRALESLTPRRRQLLGLAFFQGLTHQEISAAVGMPLGTVKSHVRRALAALQAALAS